MLMVCMKGKASIVNVDIDDYKCNGENYHISSKDILPDLLLAHNNCIRVYIGGVHSLYGRIRLMR